MQKFGQILTFLYENTYLTISVSVIFNFKSSVFVRRMKLDGLPICKIDFNRSWCDITGKTKAWFKRRTIIMSNSIVLKKCARIKSLDKALKLVEPFARFISLFETLYLVKAAFLYSATRVRV